MRGVDWITLFRGGHKLRIVKENAIRPRSFDNWPAGRRNLDICREQDLVVLKKVQLLREPFAWRG